MPYVTKKCTKCGRKTECYHNVMICRRGKCRGDLIGEPRFQNQSTRTLRIENRALRGEVNDLRERLGLGVKYREWENGPRTEGN